VTLFQKRLAAQITSDVLAYGLAISGAASFAYPTARWLGYLTAALGLLLAAALLASMSAGWLTRSRLSTRRTVAVAVIATSLVLFYVTVSLGPPRPLVGGAIALLAVVCGGTLAALTAADVRQGLVSGGGCG
jgi:hypothetical protein